MPTLDWIGKDKVINHHMDVPYRVLDPLYTYGEDTGNMIIHGDNLEALKSLLPQYEGRIRCIYIDPPYNTGNENWVYNDNVNDPRIKKWLGELVGSQSEDLSRHDKWLCMIYPRLKLLHRLLADDGAIFISIDDNEISNLRMIMDEIFGASNFIAQITLLCNPKGRSQDKYFATCHEYLLVYTKAFVPAGHFSVEKSDAKINKDYKLEDENGKYRELELRNTHREFGKFNRPNLFYPFYVDESTGDVSLQADDAHTIEVYPLWPDGFEGCWTWGKELAQKDHHLIVAKQSRGKWKIYRKDYAVTNKGVAKQKLFTIWNNPLFYTEKGQSLFGEIFPGASKEDFPQPKSVDYVMEVLRSITNNDDIVLDSFAGSGTTAHAVLNLNKTDGGNRKFILVEMCDYAETTTAERVKRVLQETPTKKENEEILFDVEITMDILKKMPEALEEAYAARKEAIAGGQYKKVGNPKIVNGHLVVSATIEMEEYNKAEGFTFYELGDKLLDGDYLNENVPLDIIRSYVYFTETKQAVTDKADEPHYLGTYLETAYYFFYDKDAATTLDHNFLSTVKIKAESYVIYADRCILSDEELEKYHITFKKIPRDITRL